MCSSPRRTPSGSRGNPGRTGTEPAGAEQPDRGHVPPPGRRGDRPSQALRAEQPDEVGQLLGEGFGGEPFHGAPQCERGVLVRARGTADAQVDPARVQGFQGAELLRDHQRGVVGQHHAAGADPDRGGRRREVGDQHGRGGAGDGRHVVVLGHPEPAVSQFLGAPGQLGRVLQGLASGGPGRHRGQVQHGQRYISHIAANPPGRDFLPGPAEPQITSAPAGPARQPGGSACRG